MQSVSLLRPVLLTPTALLSFSLDAGAPEGAAIDATSGLFTWTATDGWSDAEVTVRVTDSVVPEHFATQTFHILVFNVAPTLSISRNDHVNEGSPYTLTLGPVVDPGQDTVGQYIVHWGDGITDAVNALDLPDNGQLQHIFADGKALRAITVDLVDKDGTYTNVAQTSLTVDNVAPQLTIFGEILSSPACPTR